VVGVDVDPQPNYPFEFHRADAVEFIAEHGGEFDAGHASPPCQNWSPLNAYNRKTYPALIAPIRRAFADAGIPYVIENVEPARSELVDPVCLCGTMFGLPVYRHRLFETSFDLSVPDHPDHVERCTRNGYLPTPEAPFMSIHGGKHSRAWQEAASLAMGIPHLVAATSGTPVKTAIREVCEAIPPAYTEYIGGHLVSALRPARGAA
jgi:DNA (cytosine-5)-methyltransferase 1